MSEKDVEDVHTPESIKPHADDYKDRSWTYYSMEELGQWVALLCKRSSHRTNLEKRKKDLHDARNYLSMLCAQVTALEDQLYDDLHPDKKSI